MDGSEGEGDLVLIQTFFALLWKLFLKNTSKHKNNLIYIIMQEGLYQNKLTLSLASIHNCKMAYSLFSCQPPSSGYFALPQGYSRLMKAHCQTVLDIGLL